MKDECLICGAPLEYLEAGQEMECALCRKKEISRTRCVHGHYVCGECHTAGLDAVVGLCQREASADPERSLIYDLRYAGFCFQDFSFAFLQKWAS